jgi:hypothetical protein
MGSAFLVIWCSLCLPFKGQYIGLLQNSERKRDARSGDTFSQHGKQHFYSYPKSVGNQDNSYGGTH